MKTAFLFSGQGAQYPGMLKEIYDSCEESRRILDVAQSVLKRDIRSLMFEGTQEELNLTVNTQVCVLAADLMAYCAVRKSGILPDAVAGFSLGEYAALVAAGVLTVPDVFYIVDARSKAMNQAAPPGIGGMAAVMNQTAESVERLCREIDGYVVPVNYNCPGQITVSGESTAIDRLIAEAKARKIRIMKLSVSAPFHCRYMSPAAEAIEKAFCSAAVQKPALPIYMNVDAEIEWNEQQIVEKMVRQVESPVRWEEILRNMERDGVDTFVELGPGKTLTGFVRKTLPSVKRMNVQDNQTLGEVNGYFKN